MLPPPVCKHCRKQIQQDSSGTWVVEERRGSNPKFSVAYMVYLCYSEGSGANTSLMGHEPMDWMEQLGIYDLYDIEAGLR